MSTEENKKPQTDGIEVSQRFSIATPRPATAYPIPVEDWERLKRDILRLPAPSAWLQNAGWVFIGLALGLLCPMFVAHDLSFKSNTISWILIAGFVALGLAFLFLDSRHTRDLHKTTEILTFEMIQTEKKFTEGVERQ